MNTAATSVPQTRASSGGAIDAVPVARIQGDLRRFHIPSLDGFRAVAILLVFFSHAGLGHVVPGGFGVTIFFFLSGYLITTLLRREFERNGSIDLRHFYLRRILRIWPAFYLVLLGGAILNALNVVPGHTQLNPTLAQLLHVANYFSILHGSEGMTAGTGVFWSLAVEEHFYLLFPFAYTLLLGSRISPRRQFVILLVACCAVLAWRLYLVMALGVSTDRTYYASDTRIDSLLFGCALAVRGNPMLDGRPTHEAAYKYALVPLALVAILGSFLFRSETFRETFRYTLQGLALYPIFVAAIAFPNWPIFRVLNLRWVSFLGTISYSFYLVHFTVIETVKAHAPAWPKWAQGGLSLVLAIGLAYAMYRAIEAPLARVRKKLSAP